MTKQHLNHSFKESDLLDRLSLPAELDDFKQVLIQAAQSGKYQVNNWLEPDGKKQSRRENFNSIMHHLVADMLGEEIDKDSGLPHLLMAQCRIGMAHTRRKRSIVHPLDKQDAVFSEWKAPDFDAIPYIDSEGNEKLIRSGNEQHNTTFGTETRYYFGDKEVTKDKYEDIIATRHRVYNDFNKGENYE